MKISNKLILMYTTIITDVSMSEHASLREPYGQAEYLAFVVRANNRYKLSRRKKVNQDLRRSAAYTVEDKLNNSYQITKSHNDDDNTESLDKR